MKPLLEVDTNLDTRHADAFIESEVNGDCLPFEIWVLVHDFFSPFEMGRLMCTSKASQEMVMSSLAHNTLNFTSDCYRVNDEVISDALSAMRHGATQSQSINLMKCFNITNKAIHSIATVCTSLRAIHIDGSIGFPLHNVTDDAVEALADHCAFLEELSVRQSFITAGGIKFLTQQAPTIESLEWRKQNFRLIDVSCCSKMDSAVVPHLGWFEGLETLGVGGCPRLNSDGLSRLFETLASPKTLGKIDLSFGNLKAPAFRIFAKTFGKTIKTMDLSGNRLSDKTFKELCHYFQGGSLRNMTIRRCRGSPSGICRFIATNSKKVEKLDLGESKSFAQHGSKIFSIVMRCPNLRVLDLFMVAIYPKDLELIKTPSCLQQLSITCNNEAKRSQIFSDCEWIEFMKKMPKLQKLKIDGSCALHLRTLITIVNNLCKSMESLDIGTVLETSREGGDFLDHCVQQQSETNLRFLRISDSSFGKKNERTGFIEFSAKDWNNSSPRRSSECLGLCLPRSRKSEATPRLLKIEVFESGGCV